MSAFIVSKRHIDALVTTAEAWRIPLAGSHGSAMHRFSFTAKDLGQLLWTENFRSVNYRYTEQQAEEIYPGPNAYSTKVLTPVQALKAIACYEYQSCEHPAWPTSVAHQFVEQFTSEAIHRLPGYDAADWEIRS